MESYTIEGETFNVFRFVEYCEIKYPRTVRIKYDKLGTRVFVYTTLQDFSSKVRPKRFLVELASF